MLIKGIPKPGQLDPKCQNDLRVIDTGPSFVIFALHIYIQNPTPYTLNIEYLHVHLCHDSILIGEASISDGIIHPTCQVRAFAKVTLNLTPSSKPAIISMITKYICGKKADVEIRFHEKSIPLMPRLSKCLVGNFSINVTMPKLSPEIPMEQILEAYDPDENFVPQHKNLGSPSQGLQSPVIYSAVIHILSSTVQLTLFNPLNIPLQISKISASANHNSKHIGDVNVSEDWTWNFEPGVQITPAIPVTWSILSFGLDPLKGFSLIFDGWQRGGEVSVDVVAKASVRMGNMEMGEIEVSINGIATKARL